MSRGLIKCGSGDPDISTYVYRYLGFIKDMANTSTDTVLLDKNKDNNKQISKGLRNDTLDVIRGLFESRLRYLQKHLFEKIDFEYLEDDEELLVSFISFLYQFLLC